MNYFILAALYLMIGSVFAVRMYMPHIDGPSTHVTRALCWPGILLANIAGV
jgi:hypothetical protein